MGSKAANTKSLQDILIFLFSLLICLFVRHLIRRGKDGKMAVVVSAMGGKPKVTDLLLNTVSLSASGNRAGAEVREDETTNRHIN